MRNKAISALVGVFVLALVASRAEEGSQASEAAATFAAKCALCHGKTGQAEAKLGQKVGVKSFADQKYQASFTDDKAFKDIKEGLKDGDTIRMKPFGDILSDAQIKALVTYVRAFAKQADNKAQDAK